MPEALTHRSVAETTSPISSPPTFSHRSMSIPSRTMAPSWQTKEQKKMMDLERAILKGRITTKLNSPILNLYTTPSGGRLLLSPMSRASNPSSVRTRHTSRSALLCILDMASTTPLNSDPSSSDRHAWFRSVESSPNSFPDRCWHDLMAKPRFWLSQSTRRTDW